MYTILRASRSLAFLYKTVEYSLIFALTFNYLSKTLRIHLFYVIGVFILIILNFNEIHKWNT